MGQALRRSFPLHGKRGELDSHLVHRTGRTAIGYPPCKEIQAKATRELSMTVRFALRAGAPLSLVWMNAEFDFLAGLRPTQRTERKRKTCDTTRKSTAR